MMDQETYGALQSAFTESADYGPRAGSRWINEAIISMVDSDPALELVGLGEDMSSRPKFDRLKSFGLSKDGSAALALALRRVRGQDVTQEGVRSAVVRAAIRWRLARERGQSTQ
jgi:hypothetical protein